MSADAGLSRLLADASPLVLLLMGGLVSYFFVSIRRGQTETRAAVERVSAKLDEHLERAHDCRETLLGKVETRADAGWVRGELGQLHRRLDGQAREVAEAHSAVAEVRGAVCGVREAIARCSGTGCGRADAAPGRVG